MKTHLAKIFLALCSMTPAFAQHEGGHVGGGDLCREEINQSRRAIEGWILRDEAQELDFSKALIKGISYNDRASRILYRERMLKVVSEGNVIISCYLNPVKIKDPQTQALAKREGITYRAITIGTPPTPATCINYEDTLGKSHIDCDYDQMMAQATKHDQNFRLIHHEFASIARLEKRTNGPQSDFSISDQLSSFEHWENVKMLGPKNTSSVQTALPRCELIETEGTGSTAGTHAVSINGKKIAKFKQNSNSNGEWEYRHNQALNYCRDLEKRKKCVCDF